MIEAWIKNEMFSFKIVKILYFIIMFMELKS